MILHDCICALCGKPMSRNTEANTTWHDDSSLNGVCFGDARIDVDRKGRESQP